MKKGLFPIIALLMVMSFSSDAQRIKNRWRTFRAELHFGIGATNFLGELGGADQIGTNGFRDLEFSVTKLAASLGYRYKISPTMALNTHLSYGQVAGNDNLTKEFFRNYRNLSFKSTIYEFSTNLEFAFIKEQIGHRYRLRGVRGQRGFEMMAYVFIGAGVFHFNPKAQIGETKEWVELRPLHTEGQSLVPTRKQYGLLQFTIPVGFGFKYTLDRRWGLGLEYGIRKTFTDYIDDVSRTYVDPVLLAQVNPLSPYFADRSDKTYPYITAPGAQRGDPRDLDSYMFAIISINYRLRTGRQMYPLF